MILDPAGEVLFRHAGDAGEGELAEIKQLLRAEEPPPGPAAPNFAIGELSNQSCAGRDCVMVFLDRKVARNEIPGLEEGGFEGEMKESFEQIKQPSIRLARILAADWAAEDRARSAVCWLARRRAGMLGGGRSSAEAAEARATFGIGDQAGMVIIDDQGRVAFSEAGLIPFWKLSLAADVLGIEPKEYKSKKRD